MCLILLAWQVHADYPLVVAANRDEFFQRRTQAAGFWPDKPAILAGRDLEAGGTWLGINRHGRFAALTNYREGGRQLPGAPSRGALVSDWLAAQAPADTAEHYLAALQSRSQQYNGFNLFIGDGQRLACLSNRGHGVRWLAPGVYGLSNHLLDTPWPKLASAKRRFMAALADLPASDPFFQLLADREIVPDHHLPETGVPLAWERMLSAIFVESPDYGTRASTLLTLRRDGLAEMRERSFGTAGRLLGETCTRFLVSDAPVDAPLTIRDRTSP